jgi:sporulation protein YlmC with PRC-barrel domain
MKETAILVVAGLLWTCGSAAADELTNPSYDPNSGEQAPPLPPQLIESPATGEADSSYAADDGMPAVRQSLLRKSVVTVDGDEIGVVRDVGYSAAYGETIAVVEIDAFIGIGEKVIAIPLSQLQPAEMYASSVMTTFTRDAIEAEEAFDEANFVAIE